MIDESQQDVEELVRLEAAQEDYRSRYVADKQSREDAERASFRAREEIGEREPMRPQSPPTRGAIASEIAHAFADEPSWKLCACGEKTTIVPCWDCKVRHEARAAADDRRRLSLASIPETYRWAKLDARELIPRVRTRGLVQDVAQKILGAHRVLLVGAAGAGKTSLAVACMQERLADGALFVAAIDLGDARAEHKLGQGVPTLVADAIATRLLVLDDVGKDEPHKLNPIPRVIDARHRAGRVTWFTTGLRGPDLVKQYDDGIARRISEGALIVRLGTAPQGAT